MRILPVLLAICLPAVAQSDRAAEFDSLVTQAHEAQARSNYHAAADAYARAAAIRPDLAELWSNLGIMRYECHEYQQAEKALRNALNMNESLFVPNLFLGLDLLELQRPHDAVAYLLRAEKLNAQNVQVLVALGRAYYALVEPATSRNWYQSATDAAPRDGEAWYGLGLSYFGLAESAAAKLTSAFPQSPFILELKAEASKQRDCLGPKKGATCVAQSLPQDHPLPSLQKMSEDELEQLARDAFSSSDFRSAAQAADRLTQLYPNDDEGWYWAVRANQKLGIAALVRAGEVEPDSPRIHALLGDAYQRRSMLREAEYEYSKMLALQPNNIAGLAGLAAAYLHDSRLDEAQATARKALAPKPEDSEINLLMSEILVAQHQDAAAEPYLQHALHARADLLPRVHSLLGRVYARTGRTKEAINELTQGVSSDEDGSVYYQLARLYESSGETKSAAAAFEKSKQIRAKRDASAEEALAPVH